MRVERESLYFEPRCISAVGTMHWYGGVYMDKELLRHTEETVYVRDDGKYLYVYQMVNQPINDNRAVQINCQFVLIAEIKKHNEMKRYGRVFHG